MSETVQAVILAGGMGVRLRPLTAVIPKPMVPVAGKPYLEHQVALLRRQGIRDVILLNGYLGEQIEAYFGDGTRWGIEIRYSRETEPLGTGGALLQARELLAEDFVILYGDSYLPIEYAAVLRNLRDTGAEGVLVVYDNRRGDTTVRANIALGAGGRVARYAKDAPEDALVTHVDAGVAALRRSVLDAWNGAPVFSLEKDLYTQLIDRGGLMAWETGQRFYDIGTPERLATIERHLRGEAQ